MFFASFFCDFEVYFLRQTYTIIDIILQAVIIRYVNNSKFGHNLVDINLYFREFTSKDSYIAL